MTPTKTIRQPGILVWYRWVVKIPETTALCAAVQVVDCLQKCVHKAQTGLAIPFTLNK